MWEGKEREVSRQENQRKVSCCLPRKEGKYPWTSDNPLGPTRTVHMPKVPNTKYGEERGWEGGQGR